jgi:hypothetical protein
MMTKIHFMNKKLLRNEMSHLFVYNVSDILFDNASDIDYLIFKNYIILKQNKNHI